MLKAMMRRRPSASMVVALLALIVAMSGTAVAASHFTVNGNKVIRKHSLSGNRLKNHTITGTQVNMSELGTVPSAQHANTAQSAVTANAAVTADSAGDANTLGGHPESAFASSAKFRSVEGTVLNQGQSTALASSGSLTIVANCSKDGGGTPYALLDADSAVTNWLLNGTAQPAPGTRPLDEQLNSSQAGDTKAFSVGDPAGSVLNGVETTAVNYPAADQCYFTLTSTS